MREPVSFINREYLREFLLNSSTIHTRNKHWKITNDGVGCFNTEDNKLLGHIQIDKAVNFLIKEDCEVNLD